MFRNYQLLDKEKNIIAEKVIDINQLKSFSNF